jgi:hypothetical protein
VIDVVFGFMMASSLIESTSLRFGDRVSVPRNALSQDEILFTTTTSDQGQMVGQSPSLARM